jgi:hypothetical protein
MHNLSAPPTYFSSDMNQPSRELNSNILAFKNIDMSLQFGRVNSHIRGQGSLLSIATRPGT